MAEQILRIKPADVVKLIKQGDMAVVDKQPILEPTRAANGQLEKAKALFGENFLGEEAIHAMEAKCQAAGISVSFEIPQIGNFDSTGLSLALSDEALEASKADETKGKARFLALRPSFMIVEGEKKPVTITTLRDLFGDKNPFGNGRIFYNQTWYNNEDFAQEQLKPGIGLPTRNVIRKTLGKTWNDQEQVLEKDEWRREATEAVWDTILYYAVNGKRLLEKTYDWTRRRTSDGYLVCVGVFDSDGLRVGNWYPGYSYSDIGVCPSR